MFHIATLTPRPSERHHQIFGLKSSVKFTPLAIQAETLKKLFVINGHADGRASTVMDSCRLGALKHSASSDTSEGRCKKEFAGAPPVINLLIPYVPTATAAGYATLSWQHIIFTLRAPCIGPFTLSQYPIMHCTRQEFRFFVYVSNVCSVYGVKLDHLPLIRLKGNHFM